MRMTMGYPSLSGDSQVPGGRAAYAGLVGAHHGVIPSGIVEITRCPYQDRLCPELPAHGGVVVRVGWHQATSRVLVVGNVICKG